MHLGQWTSTLHAAERKHPCVQTVDCIDRDTPSSHFPPVGIKKGYTLKSTLMTVERDTALRPNSWWWKGIHPYVYIVDCGKGYTLTSISAGSGKGYTLMFTPCWWWKGIHPHVHTLLVVESDTSSYSHPVEKIHPHVHTMLVVEIDTFMFTPCW